MIYSKLQFHSLWRGRVRCRHDACVVDKMVKALWIVIHLRSCPADAFLRAQIYNEQSGVGIRCLGFDGIFGGLESLQVATSQDQESRRVAGELKSRLAANTAECDASNED